ncbi:MAG: molybdate ABC transporter substrate-binding protein [Leptolyngbyaceae cyanobacterium SL_7_1]|nr:molybdate ABC transporter substrate-binding protein [Leptolyngbyaceae cyanobacterium SL_7_1]
MKQRVLTFVSGLLIALLSSIGCNAVSPPPTDTQSTPLLIAAAASLQEVLTQIDPIFEQAHSGITVDYTFAASGSLQQQIEQGAPADVFISAAAKQMDALQEKALLLAETRRDLLTNRLVLVAPSNSELKLTDFQQLTDAAIARISVGEPRSVPAGQYAEEVLTSLGILEQVRSKLVYGNSVRNVLGTVESGNADAGIVYATDAKISDRVKQVATAANSLHSPITYPIAILQSSQHPSCGADLHGFLSNQSAQTIFKAHGFGIAP